MMRRVLFTAAAITMPCAALATPPNTGFSIKETSSGVVTDFRAVGPKERVELTSTLLDHQPQVGMVQLSEPIDLPTFSSTLAPLAASTLSSLARSGDIPDDVVIERVEAVWYDSDGAIRLRESSYLLYGSVDGAFRLLTQEEAEERWSARSSVRGESFYDEVHPSLREHHVALRVDSLQGEPERVAPKPDEPTMTADTFAPTDKSTSTSDTGATR